MASSMKLLQTYQCTSASAAVKSCRVSPCPVYPLTRARSGHARRHVLSPTLLKGLAAFRGPKRRRKQVVSASLLGIPGDIPFALAIGLAFASSAVPVLTPPRKAEEEYEPEEDTKFGVMGLISLIPFFDWLAWVFAYVDSNDPRYLAYAAVYAAPFLKSGINVTDDWLPIASVVACAAHVQFEYFVLTRKSQIPKAERPSKGTLDEPLERTFHLQEMKKSADKLASDWVDTAQTLESRPVTEDEEERLGAQRELELFDERLKKEAKKNRQNEL